MEERAIKIEGHVRFFDETSGMGLSLRRQFLESKQCDASDTRPLNHGEAVGLWVRLEKVDDEAPR